ncbi:hypothetical protein Q4544_01605 [Cognatishimia sp. 1_MG-2023]|uniref:hypothetical protein n=1 Tax=Cognatishimia sp. 1_MG-2023 TaxID=3062642 RepID=UPI0026E34C8A|nr:hypothetical protein [Cognatishimia sp. 1_MG-2023]MDO6725616.1 hypothetical protein [Cognatishimia sp. 1_MG-2023]
MAYPWFLSQLNSTESEFLRRCLISAFFVASFSVIVIPWYLDVVGGVMKKIERVQTGLRLEKNMLKVLKGLAEKLEMSVAELMEGVILHAFEGKAPFSAETIGTIAKLKDVYDLDLTAADAHGLSEGEADELH